MADRQVLAVDEVAERRSPRIELKPELDREREREREPETKALLLQQSALETALNEAKLREDALNRKLQAVNLQNAGLKRQVEVAERSVNQQSAAVAALEKRLQEETVLAKDAITQLRNDLAEQVLCNTWHAYDIHRCQKFECVGILNKLHTFMSMCCQENQWRARAASHEQHAVDLQNALSSLQRQEAAEFDRRALEHREQMQAQQLEHDEQKRAAAEMHDQAVCIAYI